MSKEIHTQINIVKNTAINLVGLVLPILVGLLTIPLLIKSLGNERFGILTIAWMIIGYFSIFDLGLGRALTQLISEKLESSKSGELNNTAKTALFLMLILGIIAGAIALMMTPLLVMYVFNISMALQDEVKNSFYILALAIPITIISSGLIGILSAYQRFDYINAVRTPLGILNFIGPAMLIPFEINLVKIVIVLVVCRFISSIFYIKFCLKVLPRAEVSNNIDFKVLKQLLRFGSWMTISNIVNPILIYTDRFLIGTTLSMAAVAYYVTPYEMLTKLLIIPGALISTLFPAFAAIGLVNKNKLNSLFFRSFFVIFSVIFPIVVFIIIFSREILNLWLGVEFSINSYEVMQWLAVGVLMNCLANVPYTLLQGGGRSDLTAKIHFCELILYIPLLWLLLERFGVIGASIAWTIRVTFDLTVLLIFAFLRIINNKKILFQMMGLILVAIFFLVAYNINSELSEFKTLYINICLLFYLLVLYLFGVSDKLFFPGILSILKKFFKVRVI